MAVSPFARPIPGASLTSKLGKYPYENPPDMVEIEDVMNHYMSKLADQEVIDDIALICELGVPIKPIVKSLVTSQQMEGRHSIDAGLIVAPVLHEFIKQAVEATGITVKDDDRDYQKEAEAKEMQRFKALTMKYMSDIDKQGDPGIELLKDIVEPEAATEEPVKEKPMGLMAKG